MSTFNELIDFTRSTTGTYLDSVVYGPELITNGDFATDSDWTKDPGWTIANGVATFDDVDNANLQQFNMGLVIGKSYLFSFDITSGTTPNFGLFAAGSSDQYAPYTVYSVGTHQLIFTCEGGTGIRIAASKFLGSSFSIDNISVKEVIGGQVSGTPLLRTAASNEPRLEYDASGNPLGLLIEEARTNLLPRSNELLTAPWNGSAGKVVSSIPSIAGGQCFKLSSNGSPTDYWLQSTVASNGQRKSIWARTVSGTGTAHILGHNSVPTTLVTLTEEWQRFSLNVGVGEAGGTNFYAVDFRGSGTLSEILVFGAQLETGAFPTSYIPTSGSAVTRAADLASLPVERFAYNQSKGSVVATGSAISTVGAGKDMVNLNDGTNSNYMQLNKTAYTDQTRARFLVNTGNTTQAQIYSTAGSVSAGSVNKHAGAFQKNDFAFVFDGSLQGVDTVGEVPPVTTVTLGALATSAQQLNGHIKSIQYYPKRLSNEELELLTQPSASPTMNLTFDGQATSTLVEGLHD